MRTVAFAGADAGASAGVETAAQPASEITNINSERTSRKRFIANLQYQEIQEK